MLSRLATEDWNAMAAAALASPNNVSNRDRWTKKAREGNPSLSDEQAERLGERLRKAHFVRMGKLSAQARKLAREAEAELARVDGAA